MDFYFEKVLSLLRKFPCSSQEAALAQLARLKGTLVHLLTYDHDNSDDEEDYVEVTRMRIRMTRMRMRVRLRILVHKKGSKELGPLTHLQHA